MKVSNASVRLFVLWTTLPSVVLILIALVFLKNQTKPLVRLAKAAERFGKGEKRCSCLPCNKKSDPVPDEPLRT